MYQKPRDVYDYIAAMDLEDKEELLAELKKMIRKEKAGLQKSNLEKKWKEILRLINKLKLERYVDDQIEIEKIWRIAEDLIENGNLASESWELRREIIKNILSQWYYDDYGVYDPMKDLADALPMTKEERIEYAEIMWRQPSKYIQLSGARIFKEYGQPERYYQCLEEMLGDELEPYQELIEYYKDSDRKKAVEIAELGLEKLREGRTEMMIFLMNDALERNDTESVEHLARSARRRYYVSFDKVVEVCGIDKDTGSNRKKELNH